ncbi:serine/threonine protein kinase, negative regulator of sexual conjugation and meiosis [Suillus ampliporus]|nr:serine/threonine protein kinase, negative regulator of sexual conjugation and meiosis [Suillus ampliporus]
MNYHNEGLPIPDLSGQSVGDGRFKLVELIGFGASGNVYHALDTQSDPCNPVYYAIKCLPNANISRDCLMWQRREITCHSLVSRETSSPYICNLHETIAEGPYIYLVLDYCPGGDLFTAIKLRTYEGNVFIELLDGVCACHEIGLYHRDLKPENILCVESGSSVRIADFGLSTTADRSSEFNVGSWDYMSPECNSEAMKSHYSPLYSDIWSLGVILVNMVTGRTPWGTAAPSDPDFRRYLGNVDFLLEVLPISKSFNKILKLIFQVKPSTRMSIPELRDEIVKLDSFYPSEAELCDVSEKAREDARDYARRIAPLTNMNFHQVVEDTMLVDSASPDSYSDNGAPKHQRAYRSSAPAVLQPSDSARVEDGRSLSWDSLPSCSTRSFSSGPESEGPVSPENWPEGFDQSMFACINAKAYTLYGRPYTRRCVCKICQSLSHPKSETGFFRKYWRSLGRAIAAL